MRGHYEGDPGAGLRYRTKDEMTRWAKKDPIEKFSNILVKEGITDLKTIESIKNNENLAVNDAVEFASNSPEPEPELLYSNVFTS
jgi:pyruvate dehydrogenase E1 component alpha subunit